MPGFVVNRLLFPYLFSAVGCMEETGLDAEGHRHVHAARRRAPDGAARAAGLRRPRRLRSRSARRSARRFRRACAQLVAEGALGRKSGPRLPRLLARAVDGALARESTVAAATSARSFVRIRSDDF